MPTNKERKYVDWLIRQIREDSGARSALAKGDVPRREGMAEALIIPHAGGWNIDARRLHAALIAQHPNIIDSSDRSDGLEVSCVALRVGICQQTQWTSASP